MNLPSIWQGLFKLSDLLDNLLFLLESDVSLSLGVDQLPKILIEC